MLARRRLTEPGRAGQQDVVGRRRRAACAPCSSRSSWSRTRCWAMNSASRLGRTLASASRSASLGVRRDEPPVAIVGSSGRDAQQPDGLLEQHRHRRASRRRSSPPPRPPPGRPGRRVQPSPTSAWRTWSGQPPPATPAAPSAPTGTGPIRSRSSSTSRSAPFLPIPGTRVRVGRVGVGDRPAHRVRGVHGEHRLGQPRADPAGGLQQLEQLLARRRRRSRTGSASPPARPGWWRAGRPGRPAARRGCPARTARRGRPRRPRSRPGPDRSRSPRRARWRSSRSSSSCPVGRRGQLGAGAAAPDVADGQRQRVGGVRRAAAARPAAAAGSPSR